MKIKVASLKMVVCVILTAFTACKGGDEPKSIIMASVIPSTPSTSTLTI